MLRVYHWREPVEYAAAYEIQKRVWAQTHSGEADALLVLTHPPTFTIGKSGSIDNLLLPREELERRGLTLFFTDRGGDITYHGPGQLVIYPIVDLRRRGKDVHRYIDDLEETIIRTLADYSVSATRDEERVGVWVGDEKIAAIGVRVSRWVTMHGLALNVNPDMEHFSFINPCGILDRGVTSLAHLLSHDVSLEEVGERLVARFSEVFACEAEWTESLPVDVGEPGKVGAK